MLFFTKKERVNTHIGPENFIARSFFLKKNGPSPFNVTHKIINMTIISDKWPYFGVILIIVYAYVIIWHMKVHIYLFFSLLILLKFLDLKLKSKKKKNRHIF